MKLFSYWFSNALLQIPTHVDIIEDKPAKDSLWNSLDGILVFAGIILLVVVFYWIAKRIKHRKSK